MFFKKEKFTVFCPKFGGVYLGQQSPLTPTLEPVNGFWGVRTRVGLIGVGEDFVVSGPTQGPKEKATPSGRE